MVVIFLDTDPAKQVKLNPQDFKKMQDMTARLAQSFGLDDIQERSYGLRTKDQNLLISKLEDLCMEDYGLMF